MVLAGLAALTVTLLSSAVVGVSNADPTASGQRRLQRDVDAIHSAGATGVLAELQAGDHRVAARAGVADLTTGEPVPWNSYFRIGSDTKTFVATVALQLVDEDKLALTDSVEEHLPGVVRGHGNNGRRITVLNLLRHTSGLRDYIADTPLANDPTPETYHRVRFQRHSAGDLVQRAMRRPPHWLPNRENPAEEQRWGYSNTNYLLAGMIIEKVTGHPWEQEIHERIIEPLRLKHTFPSGGSAYVPQPAARAFTRFPGNKKLIDTSVIVDNMADGSMISTTKDMNTFHRALFQGELLSPERFRDLTRTVPAKDWWDFEPGARYGLGIAWRPVAGCKQGIWYHGGNSIGVASANGTTPSGERTVSVQVPTDLMDRQGLDLFLETNELIEHALC